MNFLKFLQRGQLLAIDSPKVSIRYLLVNLYINKLCVLCSLAEDLKNFSNNISEWLLDALEDLPAQLGIRKMHGKD